MAKGTRSLSISPMEKIGLTRLEAAGYIGVTPTTFDEMVRIGDMPAARRVGNVERWDRRQIEAAFSTLPQTETVRKLSLYSDVA